MLDTDVLRWQLGDSVDGTRAVLAAAHNELPSPMEGVVEAGPRAGG